jgi:probable DNA repair protein
LPPAGSSQYFDLGRLQWLLDAGFTLLTPNQRLARRIKTEWDRRQLEQGKQSWHPVAVSAIDHWLQTRWRDTGAANRSGTRRLLTDLQQAELWRQVIAEDGRRHASHHLLRVDAAVELARQARESLLRARVPLATSAVLDEFRYDQDCATFLRWLQAFDSKLAASNALTLVDCAVELVDAPAATASPIALVDFDEISPLYRAAVAAQATSVEEVASGQGEAVTSAHSFPDRRAELSAVANWAANEYERNPDCRLGIILADMHSDRADIEYLLRRSFQCLGENYTSLPVNFSTGITLDRAPVVRDALRMLAVVGNSMRMGDVLGLLQTRFSLTARQDDDLLVKLLQQLYSDGSEQVSTGRLRQLTANVSAGDAQGLAIADSLMKVHTLRLNRQHCLPSAWVSAFCQALDAFCWPGSGPLDSLEYQQVESWYGVLESFASFDALTGKMDYNQAWSLLQRCCQASISQPQTADSGIQVLGPLEGAGLQFEQVWLCGLQGSRWPAPARPNPFIPMVLQKNFALPHSSAEREWQYAATLMRQYTAGCRRLTASYARQIDGVPELPSPLLKDMHIVDEEAAAEFYQAWTEAQARGLRKLHKDDRAPPLDTGVAESVAGGSAILQAQANCPFRAFASKRLLVEPLDDYREGLSAAERGSLLHDALYALWGELEDSDRLIGCSDSELQQSADRAVQSAIEGAHEAMKQRVGMHCIDLERARLNAQLIEWLDVERRREPFRVIDRELPSQFQLGDLTLNLRVDRVDELADGSRLVIDYKSGRSSLASWLGERPSQPQLPLYGITGAVDGIAFAQVRARDCKLAGLGQVAGVPGVQADIAKAVKRYSIQQDWPGLVEEWRTNLQRLATEFVAGHAEVDPLPGACTYCGLQALCRVEYPLGAQG